MIGRGLHLYQMPETWLEVGVNDLDQRKCVETGVDIFRMKNPVLRFANRGDEGKIKSLLSEANLPAEDISKHLQNFIVAEKDHEIIGTIGIEVLGELGLLRSLAVRPMYQKKGLGSRLVKQIISFAYNKNLKTLFLLTSTAAGFFKKHGFTEIQRDQAPRTVQNTKEFRMLCPNNEVCMSKNLE
jgi:amino-acid N-acetyltransferase